MALTQAQQLAISDPPRYRLLVLILLVLLIELHNSIRNRSYLHRHALTYAHQSSWQQLLDHGDESLEDRQPNSHHSGLTTDRRM